MSSTGGGIPGEHDPVQPEPVIIKRGDRDVSITVADLEAIAAALPDGILKDVINHLLSEPPAPQVDGGEEPATTPPSE